MEASCSRSPPSLVFFVPPLLPFLFSFVSFCKLLAFQRYVRLFPGDDASLLRTARAARRQVTSRHARAVLRRSSIRFANNRRAVHVRTPEGFLDGRHRYIDISKLNSESALLAALAPLN